MGRFEMAVRVIRSHSHDVFFNLALEEFLLSSIKPQSHVLMLWRNNPCVVIGKFQNPFKECHFQRMTCEGVALARRHSGGGAVFHDLGNSCFSILSPRHTFDKKHNAEMIINALTKVGIPLTALSLSSRGDLLLHLRKFSGAAYKLTRDAALHHATLLLHTDIDNKLLRYLNPYKPLLSSTAVASVPSRVINLQTECPSISHSSVSDAITKTFVEKYGDNRSVVVEDWDEQTAQNIPFIADAFSRNKSWDWLYGSTPPFSMKFEQLFDWGMVTLAMNVRDGRVESVDLISSCGDFDPFLREFQKQLIGAQFDLAGLQLAVQNAVRMFENDIAINGIANDLSAFLLESL
eukprot:c11709_g1_i1.p1 GENE.c11709_g1_i1~~c11709_g1_i1.p1  ORF type:complete len:348 (-),score=86.05 c11709_g1_i1:59-1102(-)